MKRTLLFSIFLLGLIALMAQPPGSGSAVHFDGLNDYVNVPNATSLNPTTAITVEAWIKADTYGPNPWTNSIVNKEGWASGSQGYTLRCGQNGRLSFNLGIQGVPNWQEVVSAQLMSTNQWYHVAGTFNGTTIKIFINGEEVASNPLFGTLAVGSYDVRIGQIAYAPGGNRYFDGQIDEVRIWNQALTATTLRTWMCKKVDSSHPSYANLGGYWQMDDGTGTIATDLSGNTNNGNLTNAPAWVTSSAPIGDASTFQYGATSAIGLAHPAGDSLSLDTISGNPDGIHIYRVDQAPNVLAAPAGSNQVDTARYWGVFTVGGTNPSFDVRYHYTGNPLAASACGIGMADRDNNASTSWTDAGAIDLTASSQLYINNTNAGEFILSTQTLAVNVSAVGGLSFCQGDSVSLIGNSSSTATYQWKLNGADINGATDSTITVSVAGSYSLSMTDQGCSETSAPLMVTVNPIPTVTLNPISPICLNGTPLPLAAGAPSGGMYSGVGISGGIFDPVVADTGMHIFSYVYTDGNGCTDSAQGNIEVLPPPTVSLDPLTNLCEGAPSIQLSGGMPIGGVFSGTGVNNNMFDPLASGTGLFTVEYTITGANGCTNTADQTIEVYASPMINAGPDKTTCPGDSVTFTASGGMTYVWSNGATTAAAVIYPQTDSTLTVTGTDANGCTNTDEAKVTILPAPVADAGIDQTICEGDTALLIANGGTGYLWNTGINNNMIEVNPSDTTSYSVIVTDNSGCTGKDTVTVFVDPLPSSEFSSVLVTGFQVDFTNLSLNADSYAWDFGDGSNDNTENPSHTYGFTGTFEVVLIATNECGTDTFSLLVTTTGMDGIEDNLNAPNISLYPNPTSSNIQVNLSELDHQGFDLSILDIKGRKLWQKAVNPVSGDFSQQINLQDFSAGMYFLEVKSEDYRVVKKFLLQR